MSRPRVDAAVIHPDVELNIYLDCGFVPAPVDLEQAETLAGWRSVQAILDHPALAALLPAGEQGA